MSQSRPGRLGDAGGVVSLHSHIHQEQKIGAAYLEGLGEEIKEHITDPAEAYRHNPLGFVVAATTNGSMTRECMLDWTVHFINHLSDGTDGPKQGKRYRTHLSPP